jgi:hypothetical protein
MASFGGSFEQQEILPTFVATRQHAETMRLLKGNHMIMCRPKLDGSNVIGYIALVMPLEEYAEKLAAANSRGYEEWKCKWDAGLRDEIPPVYEPLSDLSWEEMQTDFRFQAAETAQEAIMCSAALADALNYFPAA